MRAREKNGGIWVDGGGRSPTLRCGHHRAGGPPLLFSARFCSHCHTEKNTCGKGRGRPDRPPRALNYTSINCVAAFAMLCSGAGENTLLGSAIFSSLRFAGGGTI